jgi:ankyrin repeat protein
MARHELFSHGLAFLAKIPPERLFQLFVDGALHRPESGQKGFELREPGCMKGFYDGLAVAIDRIDKQPFTPDSLLSLVLDIHRAATQHTKGQIFVRHPGEIRKGTLAAFTVPKPRWNKQGLIDIRKREFLHSSATLTVVGSDINLLTCSDEYLAENIDDIYYQSDEKILSYTPPTECGEKLLPILNRIFLYFSIDINIATANNNNDAKIAAIAMLVKNCELLHPFDDANGRVFANILLDVMLILHGLPPATFYEPNIFDLWGDDVLVEAIKDAMSHTLFVIEHPDKPLFDYDAAHVSTDEKARLTEESSRLREVLQRKLSGVLPDEPSRTLHFNGVKQFLDNAYGGELNAFRACALGDIDTLKKMEFLPELLDLRVTNLAAPLYKGKTLLGIACQMNQLEVVQFLLSLNKAIVNRCDENDMVPLLYAIETKNLALVRLLVENGADVTFENFKKNPALDAAARYGSMEVFLFILAVQKNSVDWIRLFACAAAGGHIDLIQWLYANEKISHPELLCLCVMPNDSNPLLSSITRQDMKAFQIIWELAFGTEKTTLTCSRFEYIFKGFQYHYSSQMLGYMFERVTITEDDIPVIGKLITDLLHTHKKNDELLERLIDLAPDLSSFASADEEQYSLLHLAASSGRVGIVKKLLDKQFDVNRPAATGSSPLLLAIHNNEIPTLACLCSHPDIKVDQRSNPRRDSGFFSTSVTPRSPLEFAVELDNLPAVKILLERNATVTERCFDPSIVGPNREEISKLLTDYRVIQLNAQSHFKPMG